MRRPVHRLLLRLAVSAPTLLGAMLLASNARADGWTYEGSFGVGTGAEGSDAGTGMMHWQRARLRLSAGLDLRSDEMRDFGFGLRATAEIERRATFGGELRYQRYIARGFGAYAGFIGTFAPETLLGGTVGATAVLPLGRVGLFLEPSFSAMPIGSDLPEKSVLVWGLLTLGINVRL